MWRATWWIIVFAVIAGCSTAANRTGADDDDAYVFSRRYRSGDGYKYTLTQSHFTNGNLDWVKRGISRHTVTTTRAADSKKTSIPIEIISWEKLEVEKDGVTAKLTDKAKLVQPYPISLHPEGQLDLPQLDNRDMIGMITDLNTFFVAVSPHAGSRHVRRVGDSRKVPMGQKGVWTNGNPFLVGEDCIQITVHLVKLTEQDAVYKTVFEAPDDPCLELQYDWMHPQVVSGHPNNFQQIRRMEDSTLTAMWGHEQFVITATVSRLDGKIVSATMDNPLQLKMKLGCDSTLSKCEKEFPLEIRRKVNLHLQ